ncbi:MAG TPA: DUF4232 domain-containing protein [Brevundimonas sp.]|nr:DUF4232 domain-containing protein [Brevundimonas sp.]
MRLRSAFAALSIVALSACAQEAETPQQPVEPSPAPAAPAAPPISYACESGQSVTVAYPDTATAQLTYRGQAYTLRTVQAPSGARYAGSDLEWSTVTRDGQESATLSRLGPNDQVGVAVLERCSRPGAGALPAGPTPPAQPGAPAAPPCKGPQLKLSNEGGDAGAGNRVTNIGIQNVGAQACSLTGYPGVTLQDGQGRNLTAIRAEQSTGSYFTAGQAPAPVTLAPQEKAAFELAWSVMPNEAQGERACPSAARVRVTPPQDTSPVSLDMPFTPCGGRVRVSPIRPLTTPAAQPTV